MATLNRYSNKIVIEIPFYLSSVPQLRRTEWGLELELPVPDTNKPHNHRDRGAFSVSNRLCDARVTENSVDTVHGPYTCPYRIEIS